MLQKTRFTLAPLLLALVLASACQRAVYSPTTHFAPVTSQPVGKTQVEDPTVAAFIAPYHDKVTSQMAEVLGVAPTALVKSSGE